MSIRHMVSRGGLLLVGVIYHLRNEFGAGYLVQIAGIGEMPGIASNSAKIPMIGFPLPYSAIIQMRLGFQRHRI
jgi:hypothetical protein